MQNIWKDTYLSDVFVESRKLIGQEEFEDTKEVIRIRTDAFQQPMAAKNRILNG